MSPRRAAGAKPGGRRAPGARRGAGSKRTAPGGAARPERIEVALKFEVNGRPRTVRVPPMKRLLDVLREEVGLTGTKEGCGEGECGACTVLLDGEPVNSCLVAAGQCAGTRIVTVEGLARDTRLSALQRAFVEMGGAQCGICTPGMLLTSHALLRAARGRVPSEDEVREALAGNLCRCTGYQKIVDAVRAAAGGGAGAAVRGAGVGGGRAAGARGPFRVAEAMRDRERLGRVPSGGQRRERGPARPQPRRDSSRVAERRRLGRVPSGGQRREAGPRRSQPRSVSRSRA